MADEPNDVFVDVNTDDLDAFSALMSGKSQAKEVEDVVEDVETPTEDEEIEAPEDTEDEAPEKDDDSEEAPKEKKKNRFQDRVNELLAREREAKTAAVELQKKIDELSKQVETAKPSSPVVENDGPDPEAKNEDGSDKYPLGEFDPSYIRDMARHTIDKEWTARKEQEAQEGLRRQEQEARDSIQAEWVNKLTPITEQHEDFLDKTLGLESAFSGLDPQYSDYLVQTIKSLEHGPEVLYYFANNLSEAEKFIRSGPLGATLALGEINAMFKGQTRKLEPKVSSAPPPPQVNKGAKTRTTVSADTDDLDAFAKMLYKK